MATAVLWTINRIKEANVLAGMKWFSPSTMRMFKTRVDSAVWEGPGGVYFVTHDDDAGYTVRRFLADGGRVETVDEIAAHRDKFDAIAKARALAGPGCKTADEPYRPITVAEQFMIDLRDHGCTTARPCLQTIAESLILLAGTHHTLMELACSDEAFCREMDGDGNHPAILTCRKDIRHLAKGLAGVKGVVFQGDPRGCTVKLVLEDGYTDDWGKEGFCVPTSLKEEE